MLKCLTIVDDATTEAVAVVPARAPGGGAVTRVLEALAMSHGRPQVLRTDNGPEFCRRTMLTWAPRSALLSDGRRFASSSAAPSAGCCDVAPK